MSAITTKPLLIELFTEELPPKALKKLGEAFAAGIEASLRAEGLLADGAKTESFATPRRLGARVSAVLSEATAKAIKEKLMPLTVAKDEAGAVSVALKKKLAAQGLEPLALRERGWGGYRVGSNIHDKHDTITLSPALPPGGREQTCSRK
jgi:glycyl-tRNA synthetase beta chain